MLSFSVILLIFSLSGSNSIPIKNHSKLLRRVTPQNNASPQNDSSLGNTSTEEIQNHTESNVNYNVQLSDPTPWAVKVENNAGEVSTENENNPFTPGDNQNSGDPTVQSETENNSVIPGDNQNPGDTTVQSETENNSVIPGDNQNSGDTTVQSETENNSVIPGDSQNDGDNLLESGQASSFVENESSGPINNPTANEATIQSSPNLTIQNIQDSQALLDGVAFPDSLIEDARDISFQSPEDPTVLSDQQKAVLAENENGSSAQIDDSQLQSAQLPLSLSLSQKLEDNVSSNENQPLFSVDNQDNPSQPDKNQPSLLIGQPSIGKIDDSFTVANNADPEIKSVIDESSNQQQNFPQNPELNPNQASDPSSGRQNPPNGNNTPASDSNSNSTDNSAIAIGLGITAALFAICVMGALIYRRNQNPTTPETNKSVSLDPYSDIFSEISDETDISEDYVSVVTTDSMPKITIRNPFGSVSREVPHF